MAFEIAVTGLKYKMREKNPYFEMIINGHTVWATGDSLKSIPAGVVMIEGIGLPEVEINDGMYFGPYTDDPVILRICRNYIEDSNDWEKFRKMIGKALPIPPAP